MLLRLLPLILLALLVSPMFGQMPSLEPGIPQSLAKWRAANYSDVRYKLNLTLEKMSPVLKGTIEVRVKVSVPPAVADGALPPIILDWRKIKGSESLSTVSNVSLNGKQLKPSPATAGGIDSFFEERGEHLIFRDGVVAGENVIKLDFTSPILTSGSAITRHVDKEDGSEYIYSLFVPSDASTAFPVFDQPDLKARFTLKVESPNGWHVVSNTGPNASGQGIRGQGSTIVSEYSIHDFEETKPISTYVFAFAAGPWEEVSVPPAVAGGSTQHSSNAADHRGGNATVRERASTQPSRTPGATDARLQPPATAGGTDSFTRVFVRKSQLEKFKPHASEVFRLNREGIKFLEQYFDYKFPFPKYDLVLIPEFPFGGMEHAGATFLREDRVIFPQVPTKNDYITRANLIFHEAAHQWFGDTVTMRWFDDLWLKEGFAEFMAYKTLEKVMPEYNAWKIFYERNKQAAYLTDSTKGTTPIYQEIPNLSAAKSAYGNIVYRKAPSFLKQAEFYIGPDKFQTALRAFLKKHEFGNASWADLVIEFQNTAWLRDELGYRNSNTEDRQKYEEVSRNTIGHNLNVWIRARGVPKIRIAENTREPGIVIFQNDDLEGKKSLDLWTHYFNILFKYPNGKTLIKRQFLDYEGEEVEYSELGVKSTPVLVFPNYQDYGYGIFLLDDKSRDYVLKNIQNEKDDFLRTMMWGSLWDSVREAELDPKEYVELVIKNINTESDESTIQTLLGRVSTAMTYYLPESQRDELAPKVEAMLIDKMQNAPTLGQRITHYRAFLNIASTEKARTVLKDILSVKFVIQGFNCRGTDCGKQKNAVPTAPLKPQPTDSQQDRPFVASIHASSLNILKTKDKFDIVTRLLILNDSEAPKLLAELEKTETSDEAKRYAYAAKAGIATAVNKTKFWNDFVDNKEISEIWIESAFVSFNSVRHADLTLQYLEKSLKELPNHKRNRKIFFVNGWLAAFIGGQRSEEALNIVNEFLADNPNLDKDLRLKILENVDLIERAVKIRKKFSS